MRTEINGIPEDYSFQNDLWRSQNNIYMEEKPAKIKLRMPQKRLIEAAKKLPYDSSARKFHKRQVISLIR